MSDNLPETQHDVLDDLAEMVEERLTEQSTAEPAAPYADPSVWDVLGRAFFAPRRTWQNFWLTISSEEADVVMPPVMDRPQRATHPKRQPTAIQNASIESDWSSSEEPVALTSFEDALPMFPEIVLGGIFPLVLMIIGTVVGLLGSAMMMNGESRTMANEFRTGAPWLFAGFVLWLAAGLLHYRGAIRGSGTRRNRESSDEDSVSNPDQDPNYSPVKVSFSRAVTIWYSRYQARIGLALAGVVLSVLTYIFSANNLFTGIGVMAWIASIVVWLIALSPPTFDLVRWFGQWFDRLRRPGRWLAQLTWTSILLVGIMVLGAYFRLFELATVPPEMTSDHVEKLLDAQRVLDGTTQVFFPNNGGREAIQMYLVGWFSWISGLGMQFTTLKAVSVIEGLITIPVMWWLGREIVGKDQPRMANAVGLTMAALIAVSYWHVTISRLALRIVLTPLVMSIVMVFLARAMHQNRRADFLKTGLALGIGVYGYQAVRMIPVVVVLGVGMAFLFVACSWRDRRRYILNLAALVMITLVVFVPLGRFMLEYPDHFWMRTSGRLMGDDIIMETDPVTGELTPRDATVEDRLEAFRGNIEVLGGNVRNALLMFNWKGDVAWINGVPNRPALDVITGAFLILGLAAWIIRLFQRRDVVDWLVIPAAFIMLLPSALAIAFPVENPSHTRTSGSLPFVYLIIAFGVVTLLTQFERVFRWRYARVISAVAATVFVLGSYGANFGLYFTEYPSRYVLAAQPYSQTGQIMRGFAETGDIYGNAFMVAYPYWFDHRAMGIEGGRIDWPNGLLTVDSLADKIRANIGTPYAFNVDAPVLFFVNVNDEDTIAALESWFPSGTLTYQENAQGVPHKEFYTYIAPPPGAGWLDDYLAAYPAE